MAPSPPPAPASMSARDQRAANRSAGTLSAPTTAKSKSTSRKRQQSNAEESASKRSKPANDANDDDDDDAKEANEGRKGGKKGRKAKKTAGKRKSSRKTGAQRRREDELENAKGTPAHLKPVERILEAAGTSVAPPEHAAHSSTASMLPPPPTVPSTRARVEREPDVTSRKAAATGHNDDSSTDSSTDDSSTDHRHRGNDNARHDNTHDDSEDASDGDYTNDSNSDSDTDTNVHMYSPPPASSQRGHARDVKAIGTFHHYQPTKSSGASRAYGGLFRGKALGNAPNIGDFESVNVRPQSVDVEGTVNIFPSNTRPTTLDIDETAIIAVTIPFEEALAPLLQHIAKYYSPISDNNERVYILDQQKSKWIVKGRFRQALEFDDSVLHLWDQTNFGPMLTLFLENDPEIASAIPPSFHSRRSSLATSRSSTSRSPSISSTIHSAAMVRSLPIAGPSSPASFDGPSPLPLAHKEALLTFLGIPTELPNLGPASLRTAYAKYKVLIHASKPMQGLRTSQEWTDHLDEHGIEHWVPIYVDLVNVFIAKSQFYSGWKEPFKRVQAYPRMTAWLDDHPNCESDLDIWGESKKSDDYSFVDLVSWLDKKDVAKEKKPVVASPRAVKKSVKKEKRKAKKKVSSDSEESPERKKKSKKSKGKKKSDWLEACVTALSCLGQFWIIIWLLIWCNLVSLVSAARTESPFPDISFSAVSGIIESKFGSKISLATVLALLFTLTENTDLLNLHSRQQHPEHPGENKTRTTGWMIALAKALIEQLGDKKSSLLHDGEGEDLSSKEEARLIATKLDNMAINLNLTPYDDDDAYAGKLLSVSLKDIQPVHMICPASLVCGTATCKSRSLVQATRQRDIPLVTLIKGQKIYKNASVLTGKCPDCETFYSADHERFFYDLNGTKQPKQVYLNSAKYLKIGSNLWVDRLFSSSVINAMYSFHASASAYSQYWNITFGTKSTTVSHAHIWQAFVQDSLRTIAAESKIDIELNDPLNIKEVTTQAFELLGEQGIIRAADHHACSECTQPYKKTSDAVLNDPAAVVGVDENQDVPPLAETAEVMDQPASPISVDSSNDAMNVDKNITMVVLDGVVMGPTHCAIDNCVNDLSNSRGGSLCNVHHLQLGSRCLVRDCTNNRVRDTSACQAHQGQWRKYTKYRTCQTQSGVRRMLQRPGESQPWNPQRRGPNPQRHDDDEEEPPLSSNYFSPARYYCVETICAPCGVVIAWTKFARAESTTNILNFLESVYQTEESRPDYICIDKGCKVFQTAVRNGSWDRIWKHTSRFIVDAYHYINHRVQDYLCRKYCNPSPGDGSAPNLVIIEYDNNGRPYAKRAFNTQVCEQLNAWLAGFESILKRMTPGNFNWFLHAMLFYHTKHVITQQKQKAKSQNDSDDDDDDLGLDEDISDNSASESEDSD
ncbi:hypothetical protein BDZ97DRAFT_1664120 [Flammula alnicola]|nr:hypothetical protein BDZ97DRAFT_1664120 [Flammula alnicola]